MESVLDVKVEPLPGPEDTEATARWATALGNMWENVDEDVGDPGEGGLFLGGDPTGFGDPLEYGDPLLVSPTRALLFQRWLLEVLNVNGCVQVGVYFFSNGFVHVECFLY